MYDFEDKGGRHIALRPEMTASVARAFIQHRPPTPWKAWYAGSNFRYERPQAGRYREFHQVGIEAFGSADPDLDVEVIALGWEFYDALGLGRRRAARSTRSATPPAGPPTGSCCSTTSGRTAGRAVRRAPGPARGEPAAGPRLQEAGVPGRHRRRPPPARPPLRRLRRPLRPGRGRPRGPRHPLHHRHPPGPGPRLLHPDHLRVRRPRRSSRPRTPSAAAVATTAWSRPWAARPRPASASPSASSGSCWPATPRATTAAWRPAGRWTSSWSTSPAARRPGTSPPAAGRRPAGRSGLRRPLAQGPVQGGRPLGGPPGPGGRPRRGGGGHGRHQGPGRRRRAGHRRLDDVVDEVRRRRRGPSGLRRPRRQIRWPTSSVEPSGRSAAPRPLPPAGANGAGRRCRPPPPVASEPCPPARTTTSSPPRSTSGWPPRPPWPPGCARSPRRGRRPGPPARRRAGPCGP